MVSNNFCHNATNSPHALYLFTYFSLCSYFFIVADGRKIGQTNDGLISASTFTASSITLNWTLDHKFTDGDFWYLKVKSRLSIPSSSITPSLQWNQAECYYEAFESYKKQDIDRESQWNEENYLTMNNNTKLEEMIIMVYNLKFPDSEYEIEVKRTQPLPNGARYIESATIRARTEPYVLEYPFGVKLASGCFRVYHTNATSRNVKIFWPAGMKGEYEVNIDVHGTDFMVPIKKRGQFEDGFMSHVISLERHYFAFWAASGKVPDSYSLVIIPAQSEILTPPSSTIVWNEGKGTSLLMWKKPKNVNVTSYTVFWLNKRDREGSENVMNFVLLPGDHTWFEVKGQNLKLGLSVNSNTSSSGLEVIKKYVEWER